MKCTKNTPNVILFPDVAPCDIIHGQGITYLGREIGNNRTQILMILMYALISWWNNCCTRWRYWWMLFGGWSELSGLLSPPVLSLAKLWTAEFTTVHPSSGCYDGRWWTVCLMPSVWYLCGDGHQSVTNHGMNDVDEQGDAKDVHCIIWH